MNLNEVPKSLINSVCEFPSEYSKQILKLALAVNQPTKDVRSNVIDKFSVENGIPKEHIFEVLGVYIAIVRLFLESTDKEFWEKLSEIGFSTGFIENLPLVTEREAVVNNQLNRINSGFGKLESLKWRIDISLSHSVLVKKVPSSVILRLNLKNGRSYTIEIDAKMFHKLRFNVALILKELNALNNSNYISK